MTTDTKWSVSKVRPDVLERLIASIDDIMCCALPRDHVVKILKSTDPKDVQFYRAMAGGAIKAAMIMGHGPFDVGTLRILDFEIDEAIHDFEVIADIDLDMQGDRVHIDLRSGHRIVIARKDVIKGVKS